MDEKGKFIISLLSGHLGKANEATQLLARKTGATPVITTASDVLETIAVDTLATRLNCEIDSFENAKNITSLIVNDEKVGIISKIKIKFPLPENIIPIDDENREDIKGIIFVDNFIRRSFKTMVRLIPKNIIIGIGCRQDIEKEKIIEAIENALESLNLHRKAIKHFATVDIKKDEKGLQETVIHYDRELKIIPREEIKEVEHMFEGSEFVKNTTGVSSVCEPSAYLSSERDGKFLMKKTKFKGVTLSVWEEEEKSL
jgi:cobalt-precorrin 5A hydrolase